MAKEKFTLTDIEGGKQQIVQELGQIKQPSKIFGNQNINQEVKQKKTIKNHTTLIELLKTNIKAVVEDDKIKTAIVFPSDIKKFLNKEQMDGNYTDTTKASFFLNHLEEIREGQNIIVFTYENVGDFHDFGHICNDVFPVFKKINVNLERDDYIKLYHDYFGDTVHFFNAPGLDEIENALAYYNLKNDLDFSDEDIDIIGNMIKNDMNEADSSKRTINELYIDPNKPLLSILNCLSLYKKNQSLQDIQTNSMMLKKYIEEYKLNNVLKDLEEFVGIEEFIAHINKIKEEYAMIQKHEVNVKNLDLQRLGVNLKECELPEAFRMSLNLLLLGNPGTGKTTLARLYGKILKELGILKRGHVVETAKSKLKGEYVGQSGANMRRAIAKAQDGILFIDEIYLFANGNNKNNGDNFDQEIIEALLTAITDPHVNVIFIGAGYEKRTLETIKSYEGLESRFPTHLRLHDYTSKRLYQIMMQWYNQGELEMA